MADRPSSSTARRHKHGDDSIGNFYIDQEIGKGSFAQVYSGRHKVSCSLQRPRHDPFVLRARTGSRSMSYVQCQD